MEMADICPKQAVFQALADPTRRRMLSMLADEEMPLMVICGHFQMTRPAVSKHLHILAAAGLVSERKAGRETRYKLRTEPLLELKQWLSQFERF